MLTILLLFGVKIYMFRRNERTESHRQGREVLRQANTLLVVFVSSMGFVENNKNTELTQEQSSFGSLPFSGSITLCLTLTVFQSSSAAPFSHVEILNVSTDVSKIKLPLPSPPAVYDSEDFTSPDRHVTSSNLAHAPCLRRSNAFSPAQQLAVGISRSSEGCITLHSLNTFDRAICLQLPSKISCWYFRFKICRVIPR